jgi:hypothetical protein
LSLLEHCLVEILSGVASIFFKGFICGMFYQGLEFLKIKLLTTSFIVSFKSGKKIDFLKIIHQSVHNKMMKCFFQEL